LEYFIYYIIIIILVIFKIIKYIKNIYLFFKKRKIIIKQNEKHFKKYSNLEKKNIKYKFTLKPKKSYM
jgi:hypothetical protein